MDDVLLDIQKARPIKPKIKRRKRDQFSFFIGSSAIVWQLLFFYTPLIYLLISSFFDITTLTFSFKAFVPVIKSAYAKIILNSFGLAFLTSIICLLIAFPLAYFIAFHGKKMRNLFLILLIIPFWTNFLLHVYAWFFVLEKNGFLNTLLINLNVISAPLHLLNSFFAVVIMMVYYYLPIAVLPIYFSLERFDVKLIEASLDLGASFKQTFLRVLVPINWRAIQNSFFIVFIPAFGEFIIPELMGGDRQYFVGNVISLFAFGQSTGQLGTAFTVISVIYLMTVLWGLLWIFKRIPRWLSGSCAR